MSTHRDEPEKKIFTSTNRVYERYKTNGKYRCKVYDKDNNVLRDIPFSKARSEMKFIQMNGTIQNIRKTYGIGLQDARNFYTMKKAEIRENRIRNIATVEKMSIEDAREFYNGLIVSGNYGKLKSYSA